MIPDFRMVNISAIFQEVWPFFIAMAAEVLFVCYCYCIQKRMANSCMDLFIRNRPVVQGGADGAIAPPDFGKSVNPISTRRADIPKLLLVPPDFTPSYGPQPTVRV